MRNKRARTQRAAKPIKSKRQARGQSVAQSRKPTSRAPLYQRHYNKAYDGAYNKGFDDGYAKGLEDGAIADKPAE
jgi:flagellar biosynthesis/type III secretory pathway protein FliH